MNDLPGPTLALLSLWNDVEAHRVDEYDTWHTLEHVPERVWVPGFVAGTRYHAAGDGIPRYFTLYELESPECLQSESYRSLVDEPTPWSASMRPSFRNFLRKTGSLAASAGRVIGSALLVVRWVWVNGQAPGAAELQRIAEQLLDAGIEAGVTRVRIHRAEAAGPQAFDNVDEAPPGAEYVLLVETRAAECLESIEHLVVPASLSTGRTAPWTRIGRYRLVSRVDHVNVAAPGRPAPCLELMRQVQGRSAG